MKKIIFQSNSREKIWRKDIAAAESGKEEESSESENKMSLILDGRLVNYLDFTLSQTKSLSKTEAKISFSSKEN